MTNQLPYSTNTKTSKTQNSNMFTFIATLSGVIVGVMASLAMVGPMVQSEVASATKNMNRTINVAPASSLTSCATTGSGAGAANASSQNGSVLGAFNAASNQVPGGSSTTNTWVHKLVSGIWATNTATISGNGADSTNKVVTVNKNTTTVNNNNDVSMTNNNPQTATSGNASSKENTDSNANATSGTASNSGDATLNVSITN